MLTIASILPPGWLLHLPWAVFVFMFGACVGSFLNVVIYRIPNGISVLSPPSECPHCKTRLKFFYDNLPILGWLLLRGKCRYCKVSISPQYVTVEAIMAIVFLVGYVLLYMFRPGVPYWGEIGGSWWYYNAIVRTLPAYMIMLFMVSGLVAMTVIDARTFTIPIQIPLFTTISAFLLWPIQALFPVRSLSETWPIPGVTWTGLLASVGGMAGVLFGIWLLRSKRLAYSFADYYDHVDPNDVVGEYPHARREMIVELKFLLPCMLGILAGYFVGFLFPESGPPAMLQAIGATFAGYLVGGGLIWGIRILGTFVFGREAMGLGDVHLLAAAGAALGWVDPILVFFIAPFSGLIWAFASIGLKKLFKSLRRELPYGPHLAVATLIVVLARPGIERAWAIWFPPQLALPQPGLVEGADPVADVQGRVDNGSTPLERDAD